MVVVEEELLLLLPRPQPQVTPFPCQARPGISADPWRGAAECRPGLSFGVPFYSPAISGRGAIPSLRSPFSLFLGNFFTREEK